MIVKTHPSASIDGIHPHTTTAAQGPTCIRVFWDKGYLGKRDTRYLREKLIRYRIFRTDIPGYWVGKLLIFAIKINGIVDISIKNKRDVGYSDHPNGTSQLVACKWLLLVQSFSNQFDFCFPMSHI